MHNIRSLAVLTSGGNSPGMNAAVRAIVITAQNFGVDVYGIQKGFQGLLNDDVLPLEKQVVEDILQRGGTILGTSHCEMFYSTEVQQRAANILMEKGIDAVIGIGGEGTYRGLEKLSRLGLRIMALPGTIENDIPYTDVSIGFDTAVSIAADAINKLRDTMYSHEKTTVVEVVGRRSGNLALHAGLASGVETIIIPEVQYDFEKLKNGHQRRTIPYRIIVVSEGASSASEVAEIIAMNTGEKPRVVVLGHMLRGGTPTTFDTILATRLGNFAVRRLLEGECGKACGVENGVLTANDITEVVTARKLLNRELYDLLNAVSN